MNKKSEETVNLIQNIENEYSVNILVLTEYNLTKSWIEECSILFRQSRCNRSDIIRLLDSGR
jgi:hypothetical protein